MTRPPPRELPGFYYDPEKNRYFPIRGPIPGAAARRGPGPPPATTPPPAADPAGFSSRKRARRQELLSAREMYGGGVILSSRSASNSMFKQQYQYAQASQPTVWKYQGTKLVADKALEQLHATVQTLEGIREYRILVTGSMNGWIRLYGLESSLQNYSGIEMEFLPEPAWTPLGKQKARVNSALPSIWSSEQAFATFLSSITCVKKIGPHSSDAASTNSSAQRVLVATLGSGKCGGSVHTIDLSGIVDSSVGLWSTSRRNRRVRVTTLDQTVWAADCNSAGTQAAFGMDHGAVLLDLETQRLLRLCHSKSDILSLKFVHSGNVVLCGLRNGSIAPVDIRQNHHHHIAGLPSPARRTVPMLPARHSGRGRNQANMDECSRIIYMSSAICSLVALSSDENYFLGSSMDGSIKLFDLRLTKKGGIQSYEGHVNSHTHLPLVIDPSETLVMSGGEDCTVRIWSIKTGELIFAQRVADTPFTALCWQESSSEMCSSLLFDENHSWGAWLGSRDGLFYMHGT